MTQIKREIVNWKTGLKKKKIQIEAWREERMGSRDACKEIYEMVREYELYIYCWNYRKWRERM